MKLLPFLKVNLNEKILKYLREKKSAKLKSCDCITAGEQREVNTFTSLQQRATSPLRYLTTGALKHPIALGFS